LFDSFIGETTSCTGRAAEGVASKQCTFSASFCYHNRCWFGEMSPNSVTCNW